MRTSPTRILPEPTWHVEGHARGQRESQGRRPRYVRTHPRGPRGARTSRRADLEARGPRGANLTDASSRFQLGQRGPPRRRRRPRDLIEVDLIEVDLIEVGLIEVDLIEVGLIEVDLVDVDLTMDGESMRARS